MIYFQFNMLIKAVKMYSRFFFKLLNKAFYMTTKTLNNPEKWVYFELGTDSYILVKKMALIAAWLRYWSLNAGPKKLQKKLWRTLYTLAFWAKHWLNLFFYTKIPKTNLLHKKIITSRLNKISSFFSLHFHPSCIFALNNERVWKINHYRDNSFLWISKKDYEKH